MVVDYVLDGFGRVLQETVTADAKSYNNVYSATLKNTAYKYSVDGLVTEITDGNNVSTVFAYAPSGLLMKESHGIDATIPSAQPLSERIYSYSGNGVLASTTDKLSGLQTTTTFASKYDINEKRFTKETTLHGLAADYTIGSNGQVTFNTTGEMKLTETFDVLGRLVHEENSRTASSVEYAYDDYRFDTPTETRERFLSSWNDPAYQEVREVRSFDNRGNVVLLSKQEKDGERLRSLAKTEYKYDELGYLTFHRLIAKHGLRTEFALSPSETVTTTTESAWNGAADQTFMTVVTTDQIGRIRDSSGRRAQENTPSSTSPKNTVEYEFDTTELLFKKTTTGDNGVKSITWYDALGREKIVKSELGATTTFAYDLVGNLVSKAYKPVANDTIPETKTTYEYDRLNRPVATHLNTVVNSTNRLQKSTLTEYNAGSNFFFTKITERLFDKNNQSVDSVFVNFQDRSGSTIATVTPAAAISNSGSNGQDDGLLRPTVTLHSYSVVHTSPGDAASPAMLQETVLETIANSTGSFTTILTAIDNWPARSIKNFLYSPSGNLLSEQTLSIQNAGQLTTTDHEYDGFNRLVKVINNDFSWTEYTYDDSDNGSATGKVATIRYSNGNSTEVEYDSFGNTIKQVNKIHDRTVSEKKFTYDEKGRPLTEVVVLSNVATLEMLDTITSERHWQYTGTGSTYTARDGAEIVTTFDTAQGLRTETYTVGDEKHSRIYQINADGSIRTAQRKIESTTSPSSITSDSTVTRHYDAFGEVINEVTSATVAGKTIPVIETKYETIVSQGTITQQVSEFLGGSLIATQTRYLDGKKQIYSIDDDVLDSSTSRWTSGATGNDKSFGFRYATDGNLLSIQRKEMFGNTEIVRPTTLYAYNQGHITSITQVDNANSPISSFTQSLNVNGITQSQAKNIVGGLLPSEQIHTSTEYVYTGKLIKEIKYDRNTTDNVGPTTLDLADGSNRPENHYDYRRYYQTYANRGDFRESGSVRHSYDLAGNVDTAEIEITWNESKTIASFSDLPGLPKASDVSSPKINPIAFSWDPKLSLLETAGAADPSLSSLSLQNDWDIYNEDSLMKWSEFGELWELSRIERLKLNATEVIKQRTIVQRSYDAFGRVIQQTETIEDLKTNTELHNVQYAFGYNGNAMSLQLIAPDPASTNDYKIFRRFVYGPSGVLAVDQASLPSSASSTSSGRTDSCTYPLQVSR